MKYEYSYEQSGGGQSGAHRSDDSVEHCDNTSELSNGQLDQTLDDEHLNHVRRRILCDYGIELSDGIYRCSSQTRSSFHIFQARRLEWVRDVGQAYVNYVCKTVRLNGFNERNDRLRKEWQTLLKLNHRNVMKMHQMFQIRESQSTVPFTYQCLVMDAMDGTLSQLIDIIPNDIKECETISKIWFRQIAAALDYLHSHVGADTRVSHLAIRPEYILWRTVDPITQNFVFKLSHFEECIAFGRNEPDIYPLADIYISVYSAPEALYCPQGKATQPMDVYSLGKVLAKCLLKSSHLVNRFGQFVSNPFVDIYGVDERQLFAALSPHVRQLLTDMLWQNPSHRVAAKDICGHNWLK